MTLNKSFITLLFLILFSVSYSQNNCATAINIPTLNGTNCPTSAPSLTNALGGGGCEEGTLDTWFQFTAQGPTANITVSSSQNGFRPEFLVVSTTNNLCSGGFLLEGCFDMTGNYTSISGTQGGLTIGDTYWIVISSHNNNSSSGILTVCVNNPPPASNCLNNEECASATVITLSAPDAGQVCITDCNTGATPGLDFSGSNAFCEDQLNETVWYEFTTAALAATIDIDLSSSALSNPEYALYQGASCVSPWTLISCEEGTGGNANVFSQPIAPNTTYVLAISDATGDEGNFTLCLEQHVDNSACNTNDEIVVTATSLGSPLNGPYQPGETVSFCYTINGWIAEATGCNYLQAIVPTFGNCWDPTSFSPQGEPLLITTALVTNGVTLPSGAACGTWAWEPAGTVTYNLPGPSNLGLVAGNDVGAGWFFTTTYQPHGGDPDLSYGDHDFCSGSPAACAASGWTGDCADQLDVWTVCFDLIAKGSEACVNGDLDCAVNVKTYADGEIGVWTNIGCSADLQESKAGAIECVILPAELKSFTGEYFGGSVALNWVTASEKNTSNFMILHSIDGKKFDEVGTLNAMGNSQSEINYSLDHNGAVSGVNYYTLIGNDLDGLVSNLGTISVKAGENLAFFDRENQVIVLSKSASVEIYGTDGKLILQSSGEKLIPFSSTGIFYIHNRQNGTTQKIVVL